ncbi:PKD domain-containing protein [Methanolobus sp. ZRKC3]|uniref:PKD domain-containing protein n=1 Tax=Methanolobus sp. ZRKC3 TaxID=3125786 RepID=UPI00324E67B9
MNEIIVTPSTYQLEPGEQFTVQVNIIPSEPISGAQFDLLFESSGYIVDSIGEGDFFTKHGISAFFSKDINSDPASYATMYSAALGPHHVSETGTIATVQMTAGSSTGYMSIDLSDVVLSNSLSQPSSYKVSNARVLIDSKPVLSPPGTFQVGEGNTLSFNLDAFDPDDDSLIFSCVSLPEGASLDPITGVFTWAPTASQVGEHLLNFEVKDEYLSDQESTSIVVLSSDVAPIASINGPYKSKVGRRIYFDSSGSYDPDGNIVSYKWNFGDGYTSTKSDPSHAYAASGKYTVMLTVEDDSGNLNTESSSVTIRNTYWSKWFRR